VALLAVSSSILAELGADPAHGVDTNTVVYSPTYQVICQQLSAMGSGGSCPRPDPVKEIADFYKNNSMSVQPTTSPTPTPTVTPRNQIYTVVYRVTTEAMAKGGAGVVTSSFVSGIATAVYQATSNAVWKGVSMVSQSSRGTVFGRADVSTTGARVTDFSVFQTAFQQAFGQALSAAIVTATSKSTVSTTTTAGTTSTTITAASASTDFATFSSSLSTSITSAVNTAVTSAGGASSSNPVFDLISQSVSAAVSDAVANSAQTAVTATSAPGTTTSGTVDSLAVYNPIYSVIYTTLCTVAGGSCEPTTTGTAPILPPNVPAVVNITSACVPGSSLCVTIVNGDATVTGSGGGMIMVIGGAVGAIVIGIIAFLAWKFCCGAAAAAAAKDAPLMNLNY